MLDFTKLDLPSKTKYYYIYCISDDAVVHLPFKREFEKQTGINCPVTKKYLDSSSYWVEDIAYKLLCKYVRDNNLNHSDFKILSYEE